MAREDLVQELSVQVREWVKKGVTMRLGNRVDGAIHTPTILENIKPYTSPFNEDALLLIQL